MFSFTWTILTTPVPVIVPDVPDSETALPWFAQTTALEPFTLPSPDLGLRDPGGVIPPGSNGWLPSQTAAPTRLSPRELGKSRALGGRGARGPVSNRGLLSSALPSFFFIRFSYLCRHNIAFSILLHPLRYLVFNILLTWDFIIWRPFCFTWNIFALFIQINQITIVYITTISIFIISLFTYIYCAS